MSSIRSCWGKEGNHKTGTIKRVDIPCRKSYTAFKRLAEIVGEYCAKGSRIGVRGQLQYRQWQDDEGGNHSTVEIRARELELLSGKNGKPAATEEETPPAATEDDEIPF